ncbi:HNH endonuclease signature motif containing protein [Brevibacillus sp. DP1.3A]|uniref:HNH endonuclease signature motif containing protein n=1 Tax=Brevibacillus sp. DP1.3A TaxID=2738867 RepID=UPI00156B9A99|nr:HNH endonuclease signature motif containing protein [Brevibacillus sp. DP1.3A]UED75362.1 HNH endonuclease [Brevibacillus sp. DP1.3A]
MKKFKRALVPFVVFSLLFAPVSVSTPASAESTKEIAETEEVIDFENLPIQLAEGVTLEELAEAINEPRILESKNVTIIESSTADEVIGERQMVYSPNAAPVTKEDDSKFDFGAFTYEEAAEADGANEVDESDISEVRAANPMSVFPRPVGVFFDHIMTADWAGGDIYSNIKVSAVIGSVSSVSATHSITRSVTKDGKYRVERTNKPYWRPPYVSLSQDRVRANAETYWWSGTFTGTVTFQSGSSAPIDTLKEVKSILTNNLGEIYPDYVDPQSNIELIKPPADLLPQKREREPGYKAKFEKHYTNHYGAPQYFSWDEVEIHHMIPLQYWGTNDMDNLIPLLRKEYTNQYILYHHEVTKWWDNYRK